MMVTGVVKCRGGNHQGTRDLLVFAPQEHWDAWAKGAFVQDAFPDMSASDRELLVSGVCGPCFDALWGDEDG